MNVYKGVVVGGPLHGKTLTHTELIYTIDLQELADKSIQIYRRQLLSYRRYEYSYSEGNGVWELIQ